MQNPENLHEGGNNPDRRDGLLAQLIFLEGGLRQTKCHVVEQPWGYHVVWIRGSLVKFQGSGVVLSLMCFPTPTHIFDLCRLHASNDHDPLCW